MVQLNLFAIQINKIETRETSFYKSHGMRGNMFVSFIYTKH